MNRKQMIVAWIGAMVFVFFAWNPGIIKVVNPYYRSVSYQPLFDTSFAAMCGRLSATGVVTSLAIYTLRDKKQVRGSE